MENINIKNAGIMEATFEEGTELLQAIWSLRNKYAAKYYGEAPTKVIVHGNTKPIFYNCMREIQSVSLDYNKIGEAFKVFGIEVVFSWDIKENLIKVYNESKI